MLNYFGILDLGMPQLFIILAIVLILFGSKKLPELSRSISQSAVELRKGMNEVKSEASSVKTAVVATTSDIKAAARD